MNKHVADPDIAVGFLQSLRPKGPWNLAYIEPDVGSGGTTFTDPEKARQWIARYLGKANIHYEANPAPSPTGRNGRVTKADISHVEYLHLDLDQDAEGPIDGDPARKAAAISRLKSFDPPPSIVVDSGGGVQALWRLDRPVDVETGERMNRALIQKAGGDKGTFNADRLLRLPGTRNIPSAKKRARGRVEMPALLIDVSDGSYEAWEFDLAEPLPAQAHIDVRFDAPEEDVDLDSLGLSETLLELIREGRAKGRVFESRSEALFSAVMQLVRRGVPNESVLGIILDPRFGISESVLERPDHDQIRYAEHQVASALAKVAASAANDFDDDVGQEIAPKGMFGFTPYTSRDPASIPPRAWLYKPGYIRQFTTGTLAHGGIGKSTLLTVEALAMASGKPLLGVSPVRRLRVALWNGEDPKDELDRKVEAVRKHYKLRPEEIDGWLYVDSGRDLPISIATQDKSGIKIAKPVVDGLVRALKDANIDVLIIDPFVSSHMVSENDNTAIEAVARTWNEVAQAANCAVHLSHHAVKSRGRDAEGMDFRGGGAALAKLRHLRVLNALTAKDAKKLGIPAMRARLHFRADDGKQNLSPPSDGETWFKLISVDLGNRDVKRDGLAAESDHIGVATSWTPPPPVEDDPVLLGVEEIEALFALMGAEPWRKKASSTERWIGIPIAKVLELDLSDKNDRKLINEVIKNLEAEGILTTAVPQASDGHGNKRPGYVPGKLPSGSPAAVEGGVPEGKSAA